MTVVAIGAMAGVAALSIVALGVAVRRRRPARIDCPEDAAAAAEQSIPGFAVAGAVVGADGAGALAVSHDNRVAVVVPAAGRIVAREVGWHVVRATADGIVVETGDRRLGSVALVGVDVLDIRRLAAASAPPVPTPMPAETVRTDA